MTSFGLRTQKELAREISDHQGYSVVGKRFNFMHTTCLTFRQQKENKYQVCISTIIERLRQVVLRYVPAGGRESGPFDRTKRGREKTKKGSPFFFFKRHLRSVEKGI